MLHQEKTNRKFSIMFHFGVNFKKLYVNILETEEKKTTSAYDPHMVQINASSSEIKARIQKYTDRKREQINVSNIHDFIDFKEDYNSPTEKETSTCARVHAVLIKSKDSKGHLKVMRAENMWGPQTKIDLPSGSGSKLNADSSQVFSSGIEERITDVENHLNIIKPISSDVYSRLKKIEEKIMELESISPEYAVFWSRKIASNTESCDLETELPVKKKAKFTSEDIWKKIKQLEE